MRERIVEMKKQNEETKIKIKHDIAKRQYEQRISGKQSQVINEERIKEFKQKIVEDN
jgi:hypothetical protein